MDMWPLTVFFHYLISTGEASVSERLYVVRGRGGVEARRLS